jgi:predicted nucleic acid-binding protein
VPIGGIVADANVLLSATIGKAALRVFETPGVEVHATRFNADEVEEYLPRMADKYGLPLPLLELQWRLLPFQLHTVGSYQEHLDWALGLLSDRDPDDAHPLALARALGLPLWSNDRDLQGLGVECLPTAKLLSLLERMGSTRSRE